MLYKNSVSNTCFKGKRGAFSLVEVLMTLLILSLVMVLMAPVITKKVLPKKTEGIVYTYKSDTKVTSGNFCYTTNITENATTPTETYEVTNECSEYVFNPPQGVNYINLTLVAGGGGGGGAAGGLIQNTSNTTAATAYNPDKIKSIKINYLTANGEKGSAYNNNCYNTNAGTICGGKGGSSSASVMNFDVPEDFFREQAGIEPASGTSSITPNTSSADYSSIVLPKITYTVKTPSSTSTSEVSCTIGTETMSESDEGFTKCLIPSENIIPSKDGNYGHFLAGTDTFKENYNGKILQGGIGGSSGSLSGSYGSYGAGGAGGNALISCNTSGCSAAESSAPSDVNNKYVSYAYTLEHAGGPGGGGAGGSSVRIVGFPVSHDITYVIRVGKGGSGGNAGLTSSSPKGGENGAGGVSTSIWQRDKDGNDTLLYLVTGGAGGFGGKINNGSQNSGTIGISGRYFPHFISTSADNITNATFDVSIAGKGSTETPTLKDFQGSYAGIKITYPYLSNEPYKTININDRTKTAADGRMGAYSNLNQTLKKDVSPVIQGETVTNAYDGLYYRTVVGKNAGYVGGFGGFSGLGTKAGCGGLFMGNSNGIQESTTNNLLVNKFIIKSGSNTEAYNVSSYYDNCSLTSADGQSAEFVLPDPVASTYGQAGAGGGGGGYIQSKGPGKGGDGQNGYLMIDWRR